MKKIIYSLLAILTFTACNNPEISTEKDNSSTEQDSNQVEARTPEKAENIESFLDRFLAAVFWSKNLKKMLANQDESIKAFEYKSFPLQLLWSMGAYCKNYEAPYEGVLALTMDTKVMPAKNSYSYKDEAPFREMSVCELDEIGWEGAPEPAIYYYKLDELPKVPDNNLENFISVDEHGVLKSSQLYRVVYWGGNLDSYFDFYFAEKDGRFYWVLWNLCDCEA